MEKIQEILFENKESIPDGIYLKLMDELKKNYICSNSNEIMKITYTRIRPTFDKKGEGWSGYEIELEQTEHTIILKKGDFINREYCEHYNQEIIKKLEKSPFIPFWYSGDVYGDKDLKSDKQYIFKTIKKDDDSDFDDDDEWDGMENTPKRNIRFKIHLDYKFKYFITKVEKLGGETYFNANDSVIVIDNNSLYPTLS